MVMMRMMMIIIMVKWCISDMVGYNVISRHIGNYRPFYGPLAFSF